jgi:alpha-beta hydrolase superfamily lysophospholipase
MNVSEVAKKRMSRRKKILIALAILFGLFTVGSMVTVHVLFSTMFFDRVERSEYSVWPRSEDYATYSRRLVTFPSGNNRLQGYLYGENQNKGLVVIAHGLGGGAENYLPETAWFIDHGYRVFSYDCTGSYASEGKGTRGMAQSAIDLDAALQYIEGDGQLKDLPRLLYGHSWGGYAVAAVLTKGHDIAGSVSVAGYDKPMGPVYEHALGMMGGLAHVEYPFMCLDNLFRFGAAANVSAVAAINATDTPVLIVHGTEDEDIRYDGSAIIARRDAITNPNVRYIIRDRTGQNGHNSLFVSMDAVRYVENLTAQYDSLKEQYGDMLPDEVKQEFFRNVDRMQANALDAEYMNQVIAFYETCLAGDA